MRSRGRRVLHGLAGVSHALHGSRGLAIGATGLLVLALLEPLLPARADVVWFVAPVLAILVNGLATLAREAVAVHKRSNAVLDDPHAPLRLAKRLVWPVLLVAMLLPRVFFAFFGIPSFSPLTGLVPAALMARLSLGFVFVVMLVPIVYLRSNRRYAPEFVAMRPYRIPEGHPDHQRRDLQLGLVASLAILAGLLFRPFWEPFTLLELPPTLDSLRAGAAGVHRVAFAVVPPVVLFVSIAAHAQLVFAVWRLGEVRQRPGTCVLGLLHIVTGLLAVAMHAYDVLWIVQYQQVWGL